MICLGANGVIIGKILIQLLGCIGNEHGRCNACNTGKCPTGICTQDPRLVKRLDVDRGAQNIVDYMLAFDSELRKLLAPVGKQLAAGMGVPTPWLPRTRLWPTSWISSTPVRHWRGAEHAAR